MESIIVWFRQDLRLSDNPAWAKALLEGKPVLPVYILPKNEGGWPLGGASRWWLHQALADLDQQLHKLGSRLIIQSGDSLGALDALVRESGAKAVFWNRCYEPWRVQQDGFIKSELKEKGINAWSGNSSLLREPWEIATGAGNPYKVYTPYAKACAKFEDAPPIKSDGRPGVPAHWPEGMSLESLGLLSGMDWESGLTEFWDPTREGALARMKAFLSGEVTEYSEGRDFPGTDGTSRLSPYLHWGQLGPREVVAEIRRLKSGRGADIFYREIIWREFAYNVLYHFPETPDTPLQRKYEAFPWLSDPEKLEAWKKGQTGYPIVDAGMRQLWQTGWMHNRVRMIVASFLVKHLLHSWSEGAQWFWDTLVDADLASNTLGWQWAGGCGADAAPYFRIFNPITQSQKFDPKGDYIKKFVPELAQVPPSSLHTPWDMPPSLQDAVGCRIGQDYPFPMIDHKAGRERALSALASLKAQQE